jgi:hypothetical protein
MHGLLVDDMIHAATNDNLRDQFIREYKADFDITLKDVMISFLWMEVEHNKEDIAIHLDTCPGDSRRDQDGCVKVPQTQEGVDAARVDAGAGGLPLDSRSG